MIAVEHQQRSDDGESGEERLHRIQRWKYPIVQIYKPEKEKKNEIAALKYILMTQFD